MTTATFDLSAHGTRALADMKVIREFEMRMPRYFDDKLMADTGHPAAGQEAVAVGVALALDGRGQLGTTHRGHGHCLAMGADPGRLLAELFGRADGYCGGKGGSMHLAMADLGVLGGNGMVGAGIGITTGAALASSIRGDQSLAIAMFGDGAINQGVCAESMNLAALWSLPMIFFCENNQYAQSSSIDLTTAHRDLADRGAGYGIPSVTVDGMDVAAVFDAVAGAAARALAGEGPSFIVAETYRYLGHMVGDTEIYRPRDEVEEWEGRDPIEALARRLIESGLMTASDVEELYADSVRVVDSAEQYALDSPVPDLATATTDVYV